MKKFLIIMVSALLLLSSCGKKKTFDDYIQSGMKEFASGDYDSAIKDYQKAIASEPGSAVAYNLLGMAYRFKYNMTRDKKYYDMQVEAFKESMELDPKFKVPLINLAATYYYNDEEENALPLLKRALELEQDVNEKYKIEQMIQKCEEKISMKKTLQ